MVFLRAADPGVFGRSIGLMLVQWCCYSGYDGSRGDA